MNNKIVQIVILVVVAAAAFYGGVMYQKSKAPATVATTRGAGATGGAGRIRGGAGRAGGGFVTGQIISADSKSITVQLPNNGGSKIVFFSSTAQIAKSVAGATSDLTVGQNVLVTGATNIQLRPAMPAGQQPAPAK